jgi:hypothetical protein
MRPPTLSPSEPPVAETKESPRPFDQGLPLVDRWADTVSISKFNSTGFESSTGARGRNGPFGSAPPAFRADPRGMVAGHPTNARMTGEPKAISCRQIMVFSGTAEGFLDPDAEAKSLKNRDGGAVSEIVGQVFSCLGRLRRQIWCQASVRSLRTRRRTPAGNGGVKRGVTRMANRPSLIGLGMRQENGGCAPHEMCHALRVHRPSTNSMANAARPNRRRRIQRSFAASGHAH